MWTFKTDGSIISSPTFGSDGTIYVGSNDGHLYAIGPRGGLKWKFKTEGAVHSRPALGDDGTIYAGSFDYNLYAVHPDGSLKWKFSTQGRVSSSPAVGPDGTIYISSWDRNIYAVRPDGGLKWKFPTRGEIISSPILGPDGCIYVGSWDQHLYAIKDGPSGAKVSKRPISGEKLKDTAPYSTQDQAPPIEGDLIDLKVNVGRIRKAPSFQAQVAFVIKKGHGVSVTEKKGNWYFVKLKDGRAGWAHRSLFSLPYETPVPDDNGVNEIHAILGQYEKSINIQIVLIYKRPVLDRTTFSA